ncbi:uncharacterized protein PHALS_05821 [Plasmopara halstedii]|uniref:Uncharacterized protein n=1 Tax=Plasmopara halstedii TaxID=4781 RepID=A0A0P1ABB6_PLAHL|nr:uncharacterized protein PHALS_05821 [Plasmopara halstedii]CEG37766.1 hypothetical protein PHALS_05821 [Plasmopara halstedii]|eukprot:XP_024574135.1 hypothetical protein PHALS_05821 [Plasmopara halstedii]
MAKFSFYVYGACNVHHLIQGQRDTMKLSCCQLEPIEYCTGREEELLTFEEPYRARQLFLW